MSCMDWECIWPAIHMQGKGSHQVHEHPLPQSFRLPREVMHNDCSHWNWFSGHMYVTEHPLLVLVDTCCGYIYRYYPPPISLHLQQIDIYRLAEKTAPLLYIEVHVRSFVWRACSLVRVTCLTRDVCMVRTWYVCMYVICTWYRHGIDKRQRDNHMDVCIWMNVMSVRKVWVSYDGSEPVSCWVRYAVWDSRYYTYANHHHHPPNTSVSFRNQKTG